MNKAIVILLFLVCGVMNMNAQKTQDVVCLKNGSVIHGTITGQTPGQSVKIETSDKNIFVYDESSIDRIYQETVKEKTRPHYRGFVDGGISFNTDDTDLRKAFFETTHGCQVNDYFFIGLGVAYNQYLMSSKYDTCDKYMFPVFLDLRTDILNKRVTPFIDVKFGYSFGDFEGMYFNPTVGFRVKGSHKVSLNIGFGYDYQKFNNEYHVDVHYEGLCFKFGLDF